MAQTTSIGAVLREMSDHFQGIGYELAEIALSDDPVEERVRRVEAFAHGLRFRIEADAPGSTPNLVDDNSIVHGEPGHEVGGWNR